MQLFQLIDSQGKKGEGIDTSLYGFVKNMHSEVPVKYTY